MADINNQVFTVSGSPTINYKVAYSIGGDGGYYFTITSYMNSSGSYFGTGYSLTASLVVGGYTKTIVLKTTSDSWSGTTQYTATGTLYSGYSTAARTVTFSVARESGGSAGALAANSNYTVAANQTITQVSAPTAISFSPTANFTNSLTVSWSGAAAGISNPITGYYLVPQFSVDNSTWTNGDLVQISSSATYGSYTFDTSSWSNGIYVYFKMRTLGTTAVGGTNQSGLFSSSTIRKQNVTDPIPPSISLSSAAGSINESITVSWGAGSAGTNNPIVGYSLKIMSCSTYNGTYTTIDEIEYGSSVRNANILLPNYVTRGYYVKFCIGVIGSATYTATYSPLYSDYVRVNNQPSAPSLIYPTPTSATSYNVSPYIKLQAGTDSDGYSQDYGIICDGEGSNWFGYRETYLFRNSGNLTAYTVDSSECSSIGKTFTITVSNPPWGRGNRVSSNSTVLATDLTQLRTAVNVMRTYYGLSAAAWTDSTITAGTTVIKAVHFKELQTAISQILSVQGQTTISWENIAAGGKIKASHINQIREAIENL